MRPFFCQGDNSRHRGVEGLHGNRARAGQLPYEISVWDTKINDFDTKIGVSPVLFYDPLQRVRVTLHPNGTYETVTFDPWLQTTYDVNDTVHWHPGEQEYSQVYVQKYLE